MTADGGPLLSIEATRIGTSIQLGLFGELDVATQPLLYEHLQIAFSAEPTELVIDMSGLEFVDSSGLGLILTAHKRSLVDGVDLLICGAQPQVSRLFQVTGLAEFFNLVRSSGEAAAA